MTMVHPLPDRRFILLLATLTCAALHAPANAQDSLFTMSIEDLLNLNVRISTALKTASTPDDAPAAVFVLTREDIDNMGLLTLGEALNLVPGFTVGKSIQSGQQKNIYVRGEFSSLSEGILLLYNGQRLNDGITGGPVGFRPDIPLDNIRQIEVVRGPSSALYGANAFVAVVNLIPYRAVDVHASALSGQIGTRGHAIGRASHRFSFGKRAAAVIFGSYHRLNEDLPQRDVEQSVFDTVSGNFVPRSWTNRFNLEQFDLTSIGSSFSLGNAEIEAEYNRSTSANNWGLGSIQPTAPLENEHKNSNLRLGVRYSSPLASRHRLHLLGSYATHGAENVYKVENFRPIFAPGFNPPGRASIFESELGTSTTNVEAYTELLWSLRHVTVAGVNVQAEIVDNIDNSTAILDVNGDGIFDAVATDDTLDTHFGSDTRKIYAAFLQHTWTPWKQLTLTAGARFDHYSDVGNTLNPRLGIVISPSDRWRIKGMAGRAFRAPSFFERVQSDFSSLTGRLIENPDLRPETIETFEVQVSFSPTESVSISVNGFYNDIQDAIHQVTVEQPGVPTQTRWENAVSRDWKGFEVALRYAPTSRISLFGNYSYTQTTDERAADVETPVVGIPNHALNVAVNGRFGRWNVNVHTISRFGWNDVPALSTSAVQNPRIFLKSYTLLNARIRVRNVWKSLGLTLDGRNLLDQDYFFADDRVFVPQGIAGNARRVAVGLEVTF
jgi:iron complex outermembrane receptor protein